MAKYKPVKTGDVYGNWIVLDDNDYEQKKKYKKIKCQCQCINKTIRYVDERNLKNGSSSCCGKCTYKRLENGDIIGEWMVVDSTYRNGKILCRCSCGVEKMVNEQNLSRGITSNCGCKNLDRHFQTNQFTNIEKYSIDLNQLYGKWKPLKQIKTNSYLCECDCNFKTQRILTGSELRKANKNTGCIRCRHRIDIVGKIFGYLTVLDVDWEETKKRDKTYIIVQCKCGTIKSVEQDTLIRGHAFSCGCKKHEYRGQDLTGMRFGLLTVKEFVGRSYTKDGTNSIAIWKCICDCGNEKIVKHNNLVFGSTKSCGCSSRSFGEMAIFDYLTKYQFDFEEQFIFGDCRYYLPLRFDFALIDNGYLKGLIEFDGIQHFMPYSFNGENTDQAQKNFEQTVIRDNIKTDYCYKNKIPLLRISYEELEDGQWIYSLWDFLYKLGLIVDLDEVA